MNEVVSIDMVRGRRELKKTGRASALWDLKAFRGEPVRTSLNKIIKDQPFEDIARSLWTHHPNLLTATESLAAHITPLWPSSKGGSLLAEAVTNAVSKVDAAVSRGENFQARVIGVYLYWLANSATDIARIGVYGRQRDGSMLRWHYFSEPLLEWARRNEIVEVEAVLLDREPTAAEICGLRMHLVARITNNHVDAGYLELHAPGG